jgi:soluble lytic murein transglycosylase
MLSGSLRPGGDPNASSNYDWFNFYPLAFKELIEPWSRERNIDPLLVWAFMTAESAYNPWAISHANARGLMQMMPQTGGLIADRMHLRDYGTALIFDPEIVVPMATWYIQALLEKFNGQLPLSIPSYNAGPHRVAVWLSLKGKLPMDEFVEEIPYDEAREYTKKVLRYYGYFRLIHQGQSNLPLRFELDTAFHDNINF